MDKILFDVWKLCNQLGRSEDTLFVSRLEGIAQFFLECVFGPWRDGSSMDSEDDFNYDLEILDCVTYVEVVLALAKTDFYLSFESFKQRFLHNLQNMHYSNGVPTFAMRNHFMCIDWIQNNERIVHDITDLVCETPQVAHAKIDKATWFSRHAVVVASMKENFEALNLGYPTRHSLVKYIPLTTLLAGGGDTLHHKFPQCCIINIVRPNWDLREKVGTNMNISHVGLVFRDDKSKSLTFYHATIRRQKVVKEELLSYLAEQSTVPSIKGINILGIRPGFV